MTSALALPDITAALRRYKISDGDGFDLAAHPTDDVPDHIKKHDAKDLLRDGIERLSALQERLYADRRWAVLVVFQARDAGGKDSTIKHVMSGVNPQGVRVTSFKAPSATDLAHDFLWRINQALPARGEIGIFNRSHYEDVLVTRVHPGMLDAARLPATLRDRAAFWDDRLADIARFEGYLGRQGTRVIKFFLNVGRDEQRERFTDRLERPEKNWKFDAADVRERHRWAEYQAAYQAAIAATALPDAPWFVIPADRKWWMRLCVAEALIEALKALPLSMPEPTAAERDAMAEAATALARE